MAKIENTALSKKIDVLKVLEIRDKVNTNGITIDEIVNQLVADYCKTLDNYMHEIDAVLYSNDNPPTDTQLENFALNIPVLLYFTGEAQETLGIREDIAKAIKQELYNHEYDKAEGTIADKTAKAEIISENEALVHMIYQRAYKKVKLRAEAANEVLQSVKKVISRRISEKELSNIDSGRFQQ